MDRKRLRSLRKTERNRIKKLIKQTFLNGWSNEWINFGFNLTNDHSLWSINWHIYKSFEDDFDSTNRPNIERQPHIIDYRNDIYNRANNQIKQQFSHIEKLNIIDDIDPKFVLTMSFPPLHICRPDQYKQVDGQWIKVADARLLTDEDIEEWFSRMDESGVEYFANAIARDKEVMKYYDFVGGSEFEHECWRVKRFSGMRVYGKFELPAVDEFKFNNPEEITDL